MDVENEESAVEVILEYLAHEIHASVGVRMYRLGVCEWEVKLWIASLGPANGAWRFIVTNVTGHTFTTHVSLSCFYQVMTKILFYARFFIISLCTADCI